MRVLSWNLNVRKDCAAQVAAIARLEPDVVVLQEVTARGAGALRAALAGSGLRAFVAGSDLLAPGRAQRLDRFAAIAGRWPMELAEPASVPAHEVVVPVRILTPGGEVDVVGVYVPNAEKEPPLKIETQEGIAARMRQALARPHILAGDFNSPKGESPDGVILPFSRPGHARAHAAELALMTGLAESGLVDAFRAVNGYEPQDASWYWNHRGVRGGYRLDHIFASRHFRTVACSYDHTVRETGLSDHSLIVADLELRPDP